MVRNVNTKYSEIWPNITIKKDPPVDHEKYTLMKKISLKNILKRTFKKNPLKKSK